MSRYSTESYEISLHSPHSPLLVFLLSSFVFFLCFRVMRARSVSMTLSSSSLPFPPPLPLSTLSSKSEQNPSLPCKKRQTCHLLFFLNPHFSRICTSFLFHLLSPSHPSFSRLANEGSEEFPFFLPPHFFSLSRGGENMIKFTSLGREC